MSKYISVQIDEHQLLVCFEYEIWGSSKQLVNWKKGDNIIFFVDQKIAARAIVINPIYYNKNNLFSESKYTNCIDIEFKEYVHITDRETNLIKYLSPTKKEKHIGLYLLGNREITDTLAINNMNEYLSKKNSILKFREKELKDKENMKLETFKERMDKLFLKSFATVKKNSFDKDSETARIYNLYFFNFILQTRFTNKNYEKIYSYFNREFNSLITSGNQNKEIKKDMNRLNEEIYYAELHFKDFGFGKERVINYLFEKMKLKSGDMSKHDSISEKLSDKLHFALLEKIYGHFNKLDIKVFNEELEYLLDVSQSRIFDKVSKIKLMTKSLIIREILLLSILINKLDINKIDISNLLIDSYAEFKDSKFFFNSVIINILNEEFMRIEEYESIKDCLKNDGMISMKMNTNLIFKHDQLFRQLMDSIFKECHEIAFFNFKNDSENIIFIGNKKNESNNKKILYFNDLEIDQIKSQKDNLKPFDYFENFSNIDFGESDLPSKITELILHDRLIKSNSIILLSEKNNLIKKDLQTDINFKTDNSKVSRFENRLSPTQKNILSYFLNFSTQDTTILIHFNTFSEIFSKDKRRNTGNLSLFSNTVKLLISKGILIEYIDHNIHSPYKIKATVITKNPNYLN